MRALFLTHTAAPSGAELAMARLVGALRDVEVTVVFTEDGPMAERMQACGVETAVVRGRFNSRAMTIEGRTIRRLFVGFWGLIRLGWAVGNVARQAGSSILIAESTKALVMGFMAARRARIPLVWQVHDRISDEYFGRPLATLLRLLGWAMSDGYIANSRSTLDTLITWRRRWLIAYPGTKIEATVDRPDQRPPEKAVVAMVGRLTRWKGQDVFLRALADVAVLPAEVYLVGGTHFDEEPFREEVRRLATHLDLPVTFTGHVDDPVRYMRHADILVHCSVLAEPFGQVVVEGMNAGCAVIATRPGGTTEIVQHGVNGLLVEAGDRAQLTGALDYLIRNRDVRQRLSVAARLRARRFDLADSARDVTEFLTSLLAASRRGQASRA